MFVAWPAGVHPPEWNLARMRDVAAGLARVHPLLAELSPKGRGGSFRKMEAMPLVRDLTVDQWLDLARLYGRHSETDLRTTIALWNRHRAEGEAQLIDIRCDEPDPPLHPRHSRYPNEIRFSRLVPPLQAPDVLLSVIGACIDAFGGYRADAAQLMRAPVRPMEPVLSKFAYRLLWLKDGIAFPEDEETRSRYPADHPEPATSERWHGGTLYRWPDTDPGAAIG